MNKIKADIGKLCSALVKETASQTSKYLMTAVTFPISKQVTTKKADGSEKVSNKNMTSFKGLGVTLERDLNKTFINEKSIAFADGVPYEDRKKLKGMYSEAKKNPKRQGTIKNRAKNVIKNIGTIHPWQTIDHESNRKNGVIPKAFRAKAYLLTPAIYNSHKRLKRSHIGNAKSGWVGPSNSWYSKLPKWLKKPGNGIFYHKGFNAKLVNKIPYVSEIMIPNGVDSSFETALKNVAKIKTYSKLVKANI